MTEKPARRARRAAPVNEREKTVESKDLPVTAAVLLCEWFALCDHLAVGTASHPTLGEVPICTRCADRFELTVNSFDDGEPIEVGLTAPALLDRADGR